MVSSETSQNGGILELRPSLVTFTADDEAEGPKRLGLMKILRDGTALRQLSVLFSEGVTGELTDGQLLERFATVAERRPSRPSRPWSSGTGRWSCASAGGCWATPTPPRTPSRPRSSSWREGRGALGAGLARPLAAPGGAPGRLVRPARRRPAGAARARRHAERQRDGWPADPDERSEDLERLLHEEIDRLPDRYRVPLVLCDLEGLTHEQAARHLGWPVGTVKSRLAGPASGSATGSPAAAWPHRAG